MGGSERSVRESAHPGILTFASSLPRPSAASWRALRSSAACQSCLARKLAPLPTSECAGRVPEDCRGGSAKEARQLQLLMRR
eukprot:5769522-Prorocentrum_lima.AAC.1